MPLSNSPSLEILIEELKKKLTKMGIKKFVSLQESNIDELKVTGSIDIVLFGDAPRFFLDKINWNPNSKYRFWVFSKSSKQLLTYLIGIPEDSITVIDRYQLFPYTQPIYNFSSSKSFVYAGRFGKGKNTLLLANVFAKLQRNNLFKNHSFYFCGNEDKNEFQQNIKNLEWTNPPIFLDDLGKEWHQHPFDKPIFSSLSTYLMEDFSVSAAQAQMNAFPTLTTDWYGFNDIQGTVNIKIPTELCLSENIELASTQISKLIISQTQMETDLSSVKLPVTSDLQPPSAWVTGEELIKLIDSISPFNKALMHCYFFVKISGDGQITPLHILLRNNSLTFLKELRGPALGRYALKDGIFSMYDENTNKCVVFLSEFTDYFEINGNAAKLFACIGADVDIGELAFALLPDLYDEDGYVLKEVYDFILKAKDFNLIEEIETSS